MCSANCSAEELAQQPVGKRCWTHAVVAWHQRGVRVDLVGTRFTSLIFAKRSEVHGEGP